MKSTKLKIIAVAALSVFAISCAASDYSTPGDATKTGVAVPANGGYAISFSSFPDSAKPLTALSASTNNSAVSSSTLVISGVNTLAQGAVPFVLTNPNYNAAVATGQGSTNFVSSIEAVVSCGGTTESGRLIAFLNAINSTTLSGTGLTTAGGAGGGIDCNTGKAIVTAYLDTDNDGYIDVPDGANSDFLYASATLSGGGAVSYAAADALCGGYDATTNLTAAGVLTGAACGGALTGVPAATAANVGGYYEAAAAAITSFSNSTEYTIKIVNTYTAATASYNIEVFVNGTSQMSKTILGTVVVPKLKNSTTTPFNVVLAGTGTPGNNFAVNLARASTTTSPYIKSIKVGRS